MGQSSSTNQEHVKSLEARTGKLSLSARYHKAPKTIEADYNVSDDVLGTGYSGVVRRATRKGGNDDMYAIKAFKFKEVASDKRQQLESEVSVFLVMDHPHITRLFDVYESKDHLHLVMECCEGGELFDRVLEVKTFSERLAADAVWQMLLALNYIHSHGIVHRDLKLENFLYDKKDSNHLKLIDFGFSKVWDANVKMHMSCGTLSYVAPEVLMKSYTSQCDLWSLGVIAFILLAGYMPFHGDEAKQTKAISEGKFQLKPDRWKNISKEGYDFVKSLLRVNPEKRLTAHGALEHVWIANRDCDGTPKAVADNVPSNVVDALRSYGSASKFRRCCLEMMAWSLSNEERAKVRSHFISMDANKQGTITLQELKKVLEEHYQIDDAETRRIFDALDSNQDEEIHYSDFLAAMVSTRIQLHDDLMSQAFKKFDADGSGFITAANLREILGDDYDASQVDKFIQEADLLKDGKISFEEFKSYLRGDSLAKRDASPSTASVGSGANAPAGCFSGVTGGSKATTPLKRPSWGRRRSQDKPAEEEEGSSCSVQ